MIPGNQFWRARSSHGRNPKFKSKKVLWEACCEYFDWCEDNPLYETQCFSYKGDVTQEPVAKMRAMTVTGLCIFLDISQETWRAYKKRSGFLGVCEKVEEIIYNQKFQGASAGLLNHAIIARDLGLVDKRENENKHTFGDDLKKALLDDSEDD